MSNEDIAPPLDPSQQKEIDDAKAAAELATETPVQESFATTEAKTTLLEVGEEDNTFLSPVRGLLMVNLNLASRAVFSDAAALKHVAVGELDYNAYSPLRKKDKEKPNSAGGIALPALHKAYKLLETLNSARTVILGEEDTLEKRSKRILDKMLKEIEASLPLPINEKLGEVNYMEDSQDIETSEVMPIAITVKDIVRVTGWINHNENIDPDKTVNPYTVVVCLTINSGYFYAQEYLHKYVLQMQNTLSRLRDNSQNDSEIILGVMMDPKDDKYLRVRDFKNVILDENDTNFNYKIYSREDLYKYGSETGWSPLSKNEVDQNLLTVDGDILYLKYP
jgi:hypothetical protein